MIKTEDILGLGAFFLPLLKKGNKKTGGDLDRFKNYPNSGGEFGGGYYDKQTQETISEQRKKDSASYFGDKGSNSAYDAFYDYTSEPSQAGAFTSISASDATAYEQMNLGVRVRIVPNSFFCSATTEKMSDGKLRELHTYACIVEIFNPLPDIGGTANSFKLEKLEYALPSQYQLNKQTDKWDMSFNMKVIDAQGNFQKAFFDTKTSGQYHVQLEERLITSPLEFVKKHASVPWSAAYADGYQDRVAPRQSVYVPVLLSYAADPKGDFDMGVYKTPLYMNDPADFFTYDQSHKNVTGFNTLPVRGFEFPLVVGIRTGRTHRLRISQDKDSYKYSSSESFSNSNQLSEYFQPNSTPIFQRPEFWASIFGQKNINSLEQPTPPKVRSYFAAASTFLTMEKFAPFGSMII